MNRKSESGVVDGERAGARITRDFDFPRALVFHALTDSKVGAKVWGPKGSVKHLFEIDPRPGGTLRIHDGNAEGIVAKTVGTITEFVPPERFEFRSATTFHDGSAPFRALQSVRLEELGPKRTRVSVHVKVLELGAFPGPVEDLEGGFEGGWGETFDMLQEELG